MNFNEKLKTILEMYHQHYRLENGKTDNRSIDNFLNRFQNQPFTNKTLDEIKMMYRKLSNQIHPDRSSVSNKSIEELNALQQTLNSAYNDIFTNKNHFFGKEIIIDMESPLINEEDFMRKQEEPLNEKRSFSRSGRRKSNGSDGFRKFNSTNNKGVYYHIWKSYFYATSDLNLNEERKKKMDAYHQVFDSIFDNLNEDKNKINDILRDLTHLVNESKNDIDLFKNSFNDYLINKMLVNFNAKMMNNVIDFSKKMDNHLFEGHDTLNPRYVFSNYFGILMKHENNRVQENFANNLIEITKLYENCKNVVDIDGFLNMMQEEEYDQKDVPFHKNLIRLLINSGQMYHEKKCHEDFLSHTVFNEEFSSKIHNDFKLEMLSVLSQNSKNIKFSETDLESLKDFYIENRSYLTEFDLNCASNFYQNIGKQSIFEEILTQDNHLFNEQTEMLFHQIYENKRDLRLFESEEVSKEGFIRFLERNLGDDVVLNEIVNHYFDDEVFLKRNFLNDYADYVHISNDYDSQLTLNYFVNTSAMYVILKEFVLGYEKEDLPDIYDILVDILNKETVNEYHTNKKNIALFEALEELPIIEINQHCYTWEDYAKEFGSKKMQYKNSLMFQYCNLKSNNTLSENLLILNDYLDYEKIKKQLSQQSKSIIGNMAASWNTIMKQNHVYSLFQSYQNMDMIGIKNAINNIKADSKKQEWKLNGMPFLAYVYFSGKTDKFYEKFNLDVLKVVAESQTPSVYMETTKNSNLFYQELLIQSPNIDDVIEAKIKYQQINQEKEDNTIGKKINKFIKGL